MPEGKRSKKRKKKTFQACRMLSWEFGLLDRKYQTYPPSMVMEAQNRLTFFAVSQ